MQMEHFQQEGYGIVPQLLSVQTCDNLCTRLAEVTETRPGSRRLLEQDWCRDLARKLKTHPLISVFLGSNSVVNQCTYFDKSPHQNWLVPLHQDVSIAVQPNSAAVQWGGVVKEEITFVQPSVGILEQLVALRVHLDDSTPVNGSLKVVPASHRYSRLTAPMILQLRALYGEVSCLVPKGGVLVMRPLLLHGSSKMTGSTQWRVLLFYVVLPN